MTEKKKQTKRKISGKNVATVIVGSIVSIMLIGAFAGLFLLMSFLSDMPEVKVSDFESLQSSQVYDANGILVADVGETIRTNVKYDELPTSLVDAFISVEDSRYFEHNGFDIPRFTKAAINNLISMSLAEGGSTFTMQLIDNSYFMDTAGGISKLESIKRKVQEIFLSMEAEDILSKQRILELYLNKINFGGTGNIRGVAKAAEYYFNKDVSELNLAESAMLAGIVNAPYTFDPFNFLDHATKRRDTVLYLMNYHGYITDTEYQLAKSIKVEDLLVDPNAQKEQGVGIPYQAYIDVVIDEVKQITGYDPIYTPMKIYTYLDTNVQSVIDEIQAGKYPGIEFPDELIELGVVSMNNKTGAINAIGGGRNYANGGSLLFNHATQQFKQPGSTVKPFLSYALAFENLGWATSHTVTDKPINYRGTDIVIKNASNQYFGDVTLDYAFGNSLNTPAIQTLQEVIDNTSLNYVIEYLQSLGFSKVQKDNFSMGYAIGGAEFEVTVEELAGAMSAMINGGTYNVPHTVYKIELLETGEVIEPTYTPTQVISPESAYLVSELMYSAVSGPYYNYMQILKENYPVYAKTGTTDYGTSGLEYGIPKGAAKDIWMVGATSEYTVATWYGYPKAIKDKNTWINDSKNKANIRGKITNAVLDADHANKKAPAAVSRPSGIVDITHVLGVYPYTSIIEGMDETFVAHGKINKKFASLLDPMGASIENLNDLNVTVSPSGEVNIQFNPYPDESKLSVVDAIKDISLSVGNIYVEAFGNRIFDWSWVFGPIRYRGSINVNNVLVNEFVSESNAYQFKIEKLNPGDTIKVCGVYAYENLPLVSNEVCKEFKVDDKEVTILIPKKDAKLAEIEQWALTNNLTLEYLVEKNNKLANTNLITIDGVDVNNKPITQLQSIWLKSKIVVTTYISDCGPNSTLVNGACVCDPGFVEDTDKGCIAPKPTPTPTPTPDPSPTPTPEVSPTPTPEA